MTLRNEITSIQLESFSRAGTSPETAGSPFVLRIILPTPAQQTKNIPNATVNLCKLAFPDSLRPRSTSSAAACMASRVTSTSTKKIESRIQPRATTSPVEKGPVGRGCQMSSKVSVVSKNDVSSLEAGYELTTDGSDEDIGGCGEGIEKIPCGRVSFVSLEDVVDGMSMTSE